MRPTLLHYALILLIAAPAFVAGADGTIVLEAEDGVLTGTSVATTRPAYSGRGYVTGFDQTDDKVAIKFDSEGGIFDCRIHYASQSPKQYAMVVNGVSRSGGFDRTDDGFAVANAGKVELSKGPNTIELRRGWGHFDIDRIDLVPARIGDTLRPPVSLVTPEPTSAATALLSRLIDTYGRQTLSGVFSIGDARFVHDVTGKTPAVIGGDLIEYSPSRVEHGSKPGRTAEELIARAKEGHVVSVMWHWNAPRALIDAVLKDDKGKETDARWYKGFYTNATTFDVAAALADPAGEDYRLLIRDIDAIALQLRKFADAGVPVLWRPLHEADGKWFWWGAKGPTPFKQLWALVYDRLARHHHLNNLIWVYTGTGDFEWYPPDDQFDVVGVDAYPSDPHDPLSPLWETIQSRYAGRKLVALSEFGGVPDVDAMHRLGVRFAYFNSWVGKNGPHNVPKEELVRIYGSPSVGNLEP